MRNPAFGMAEGRDFREEHKSCKNWANPHPEKGADPPNVLAGSLDAGGSLSSVCNAPCLFGLLYASPPLACGQGSGYNGENNTKRNERYAEYPGDP